MEEETDRGGWWIVFCSYWSKQLVCKTLSERACSFPCAESKGPIVFRSDTDETWDAERDKGYVVAMV